MSATNVRPDVLIRNAGEAEKVGTARILVAIADRYLREVTAMRARGEKPTAEFFRSYDIFDV